MSTRGNLLAWPESQAVRVHGWYVADVVEPAFHDGLYWCVETIGWLNGDLYRRSFYIENVVPLGGVARALCEVHP